MWHLEHLALFAYITWSAIWLAPKMAIKQPIKIQQPIFVSVTGQSSWNCVG